MSLLPGALCGLAVLLGSAPPRLVVARRRVRGGLPLLCAVVGAGVVLAGVPVAVAGIGGGVLLALVRELARRRRRIEAAERSEQVLAVCDGLAADLRAGSAPVLALRVAAGDWDEFRPVADAATLGADVPEALRSLAGRPGAGSLRLVAAAWIVAHRSGAGLADAVGLAARTIREDRATARVVQTELASARATARLLAVLPVGVLLIGRGAGGDPIGFLLGTTPGLVCLGSGLLLSWAGLQWLERIADGITDR